MDKNRSFPSIKGTLYHFCHYLNDNYLTAAFRVLSGLLLFKRAYYSFLKGLIPNLRIPVPVLCIRA